MGVSIRKRKGRKGSHYQVVADLGPDPATGQRRQRTKDCPSKEEAKDLAAQWRLEIKHGIAVEPSTQTLTQLLEHWLKVKTTEGLRPKTIEDYERTVRTHILPAIGGIQIQKLTGQHIEAFYAALDGRTVGRRTIELCHLRIKAALAYAERQGLVPRNVARLVTPPRDDEDREMTVWTSAQARAFLTAAREHSIYGPIWLVALRTGMRRGELLGLRWQDVHWERSVLAVRQSVGLVRGRITMGQPKTKAALRDVAVTETVLSALREYRRRQNERRLALGEHWHDHGLVFTSEIGTPINPSNLIQECHKLAARAAVPRIRIHDIRHTYVTWALEDGADLKAVSEQVGHARTAITKDIYQHISQRQSRDVAERVERRLDDGTGEDLPAVP